MNLAKKYLATEDTEFTEVNQQVRARDRETLWPNALSRMTDTNNARHPGAGRGPETYWMLAYASMTRGF